MLYKRFLGKIIKGGTDNIDNIQPLCFKCNVTKHTNIKKYEKD